MKRFYIFFTFFTILLTLFSCKSQPIAESSNEEAPETAVSEDEEIINDVIISDEDEVVDVSDEPVELNNADDEEYLRSTNNMGTETVTKDEFAEDKAEILRIISEMEKIMEDEDFEAWMNYIAPDSIRYYSNPVNIKKAQKKLPDKTKKLNGIEDYFKLVFIPARKRSQVTEIRYLSKTNIKAVELKDNGKVIAYYQFVKLNDKWLIHIPSL
ncbi:MAG: hypothetical protein K5829_06545 [Treponema sp.]|nr:hypothetical protein [Treponema sp.]